MTKAFAAALTILIGAVFYVAGANGDTAFAQTATKLNCKGCVRGKQLGNSAVTKQKIKKNAVSASRLGADAKPGGIDFGINQTVTPLSTTDTLYAQLDLNVPSPGYILATVSGNIDFSTATDVSCYFDDGTPNGIRIGGAFNADTGGRDVFSQTHVITVLNAGPYSVLWRCFLGVASAGTQFNGYEATALFVPNHY